MTDAVLIAGTASHVGKSTVVAGLCRALSDRGVDVAPFKAQNMSNNARVALRPDGEWGEIGVSQYVQARAARVPPSTDHNPVLLKPRGDAESQLVIDGTAVDHFGTEEYYERYWERARDAARQAYERLADEHDVIVAEGAGSIAEINLHDRDLANLETARFADADVVLLADIERGGAFASLFGTIELVPPDIRDRLSGAVLTKFRGEQSLLQSGIDEIESRTGVPIVGVIPYRDPGLPAEDSVSLPAADEAAVHGGDDGVPDDRAVRIAVPRFPRLANATDLEPLASEPGVRVAFTPLEGSLEGADAVVLPGTKNTVDDLIALHDAGFAERIRRFDGPVIGLCGGFQMLGERITNAGIESANDVTEVHGLGLLPIETEFSEEKRVERVVRHLSGSGPLEGASGSVTGYEIHMGHTVTTGAVDTPLGDGSAATDCVLGTYLHGLFENAIAREAFVDNIAENRGIERQRSQSSRHDPFEAAAGLITDHLDDALLPGLAGSE